METSPENFLSRQNQSSHTNKAQFSSLSETNLTSGSSLVDASGKTSQGYYETTSDYLPPLPRSSKKSGCILSAFCKSGICRKSVSQSLSFVFRKAHVCDSPFYILWSCFRLKFFFIVIYLVDHIYFILHTCCLLLYLA